MLIQLNNSEAFLSETEKVDFKLEDIPKLIAILQTETNVERLFFATHGFRKLLSMENDPPFRETIDSGLVPKFLELCSKNEFPKLQYEAAWCLTNLASGDSEHTKLLVDHGTIAVLCHLL